MSKGEVRPIERGWNDYQLYLIGGLTIAEEAAFVSLIQELEDLELEGLGADQADYMRGVITAIEGFNLEGVEEVE